MSMHGQQTLASSPFETPSLWQAFWRLPSLTIARFTLLSYVRSAWILVDIVLVWLLYAIFFFEFGGNAAYFFGTSGQGLGAVTILGTVIMAQRAFNARLYLPLSRITSRGAYIRGVVIAATVLRIPLFLMLLALAASYHQFIPPCSGFMGCIVGANAANLAAGSIGLLANCIVIAALIVAFSPPVATRLARIGLLAWLAAVLYSNTSPGPIGQILSITRIPLIPLQLCYNMGATGAIDWPGLAGLLFVAGYVVGLTALAQFWMRKRDLVLQ
jgi:hypothetical protein